MDMQHVHDYAALTWPCSMPISMLCVGVHASCPSTCRVSMFMPHDHLHAACPRPCHMYISTLQFYVHVACPCYVMFELHVRKTWKLPKASCVLSKPNPLISLPGKSNLVRQPLNGASKKYEQLADSVLFKTSPTISVLVDSKVLSQSLQDIPSPEMELSNELSGEQL